MLGGDLDAYVHMIRHQVAFNEAAFLLTSQRMEDGAQGFPNLALQAFSSPLGHKHDRILVIPP
jgi:hypothetical protein